MEALLRSDELPVISEIEVRNAMRCLDGGWLFGGFTTMEFYVGFMPSFHLLDGNNPWDLPLYHHSMGLMP